jgi:hypothetical protein
LRWWRSCIGPESAKRTAQNEDALLAVALKFLDSRKDAIVHGVRNVLLTAEVFFRRLDGRMPQQKLYLLEIPAGLAAQFLACPS